MTIEEIRERNRKGIRALPGTTRFLLSRIDELEAEVERAWQKYDQMRRDRAEVLNVKSTDGLSSSEWLMRTAKAEAENARLRGALELIAYRTGDLAISAEQCKILWEIATRALEGK